MIAADPAAVFDLPQQLQPYQEGRVEGVAKPTAGAWRAGSVVWNRGAWEGARSHCFASFSFFATTRLFFAGVTAEQPAGWVCVEPGQPGVWANLSLGAR